MHIETGAARKHSVEPPGVPLAIKISTIQAAMDPLDQDYSAERSNAVVRTILARVASHAMFCSDLRELYVACHLLHTI